MLDNQTGYDGSRDVQAEYGNYAIQVTYMGGYVKSTLIGIPYLVISGLIAVLLFGWLVKKIKSAAI